MLVFIFLLFLPFLHSITTEISDLSYFPCYYGGYDGGSNYCADLSIDLVKKPCLRIIFDLSFFTQDNYTKFFVAWTKDGKVMNTSNTCSNNTYKTIQTYVAGDLLDFHSIDQDMRDIAKCNDREMRVEKELHKCMEQRNKPYQSCYSGVLIENGTIPNSLTSKSVSGRCGWFVLYIYNEIKKAYEVKVIASHIHHTKERHSCWMQMTNLLICVCEGDNCNNNVVMLMERLMEMPFDLDRSGPMVFHSHNKFTTNQLTAEIAKIHSIKSKCEENCSIKVFYHLADDICEIAKFSLNHTEVIENTEFLFFHCTFKGCSSTPNMHYLSYLTSKPNGIPHYCRKPLFIVDIVNYVTDDGWDVYWTEPKPLKKKRG